MSHAGFKTLLVDMDPQSHCAVGLGSARRADRAEHLRCAYKPARGESLPIKEVVWEIAENFDLAPASIDLAAFEQQMSGIAESRKLPQNSS